MCWTVYVQQGYLSQFVAGVNPSHLKIYIWLLNLQPGREFYEPEDDSPDNLKKQIVVTSILLPEDLKSIVWFLNSIYMYVYLDSSTET